MTPAPSLCKFPSSLERSCTCKPVVGLKIRIVHSGLAGRRAELPDVVIEVPALSLVEDGEEQKEVLYSRLQQDAPLQCPGTTNQQRTDQTRVDVLLLGKRNRKMFGVFRFALEPGGSLRQIEAV